MTDEKKVDSAPSDAPAPPPPAAKRRPRVKKETSVAKMKVRSAGNFVIVHSKQGVRIPTNASVEVEVDDWTLKQIKLGTLVEV